MTDRHKGSHELRKAERASLEVLRAFLVALEREKDHRLSLEEWIRKLWEAWPEHYRGPTKTPAPDGVMSREGRVVLMAARRLRGESLWNREDYKNWPPDSLGTPMAKRRKEIALYDTDEPEIEDEADQEDAERAADRAARLRSKKKE